MRLITGDCSLKVNEAGYPVDDSPFSQSILGLPSLLETNGMVFSKKKSKKSGKEKLNDFPSWAKGQKPNSGENGKDFAKRLMDEQYGLGQWENKGFGPGTEYSEIKKAGNRNN